MSDVEYPFEAEWAERQAEPMPEFGIDWTIPSPLTFDRIPERKTEERQFFDRKEKELYDTDMRTMWKADR